VRTDDGSSCIVRWRLGGEPQHETVSKTSDERNLAQAEGFKRRAIRTSPYGRSRAIRRRRATT